MRVISLHEQIQNRPFLSTGRDFERYEVAKNYERIRLSLAGLDIYLCLCQRAKLANPKTALLSGIYPLNVVAANPGSQFDFHMATSTRQIKNPIKTIKDRKESRPHGFGNTKEREFHDPEKHAKEAMSREAKILLRVAVLSYAVTKGQIQRLQTEVLASGSVGPCELKKNHEMTPVLYFEGTLFESIKFAQS
ncbi:hypothetical protein METSCH_D04500 [Metschnikowia aff. pulcherrima]|uniref:Uncharacterized protein n=1 Tax=Metschnikowia aff. pulcherrima TaxID=2163413 RepID=A0A4P6XPS3_9ASCO|nr:hypothetical protein METSCH_D04500 [Metschnikowia aff. pulcherrima]